MTESEWTKEKILEGLKAWEKRIEENRQSPLCCPDCDGTGHKPYIHVIPAYYHRWWHPSQRVKTTRPRDRCNGTGLLDPCEQEKKQAGDIQKLWGQE